MKVLLLAAGHGERMRPLTDEVPKPLLEVGGRALIEHQLDRLAAAGLTEIVINLAWMGEAIRALLGDGARYGVHIEYSDEGSEPLETAGAVVHARHLLGAAPFVMVNADVWTDFPFATLALPPGRHAHLVLAPNPDHNPGGDFALLEDGGVVGLADSGHGTGPKLTFAGIGVYDPALFDAIAPGKTPLAPLLYAAAARGLVSGERYTGTWVDVGTPERLQEIRENVLAKDAKDAKKEK